METDITCDKFLVSNTTISSKTGLDYSCHTLQNRPTVQSIPEKCELPPGDFLTISSSFSMSQGSLPKDDCTKKKMPIKASNISFELARAKSILQQLSSISGDNLFDHLSDIIKRVIDERPPNVIDFFEEFSRNVREQKFHLPDRFPPVYEEKRSFRAAKQQLISMKLPYMSESTVHSEDELEEERSKDDILRLEIRSDYFDKFRTFNDRVQHLQFYWNQCGLSISSEDIFQLACSMNRLQTHPSIKECRFWGMINGLKASYYIVEAILTKKEYELRALQMKKEMHDNFMSANIADDHIKELTSHIGPELTPGAVGWENQSQEDMARMKPSALPVPLMKRIESFDIPPEPLGRGVNRYSYFVVNSLTDEWTELPIVTPKQISQSRDIKKFFTGDLEEDVNSYPCFNGKEKHYLRAMIARITAGTYIAPRNYYRKITKKERQLLKSGQDDGEEVAEKDDERESEMEEEEDDEENQQDNDVLLLKNENYNSSAPLNTLSKPAQWVHVRPNILLQGRVVWYDQEKAERERDKERKHLRKMLLREQADANESGNTENEEDDEQDDDDDEKVEEEQEIETHAEDGPAILTSCSHDVSSETKAPWVVRFTSQFTNHMERILVMRSNVWPGAYTFTFKDICESIYLGWGHKLVSRNITWKHPPPIKEEYKHELYDFIETVDPTVEMEEAYKLSLLKKKFEKMEDFDEHAAQESNTDDEDEYEEDEQDEDEE